MVLDPLFVACMKTKKLPLTTSVDNPLTFPFPFKLFPGKTALFRNN